MTLFLTAVGLLILSAIPGLFARNGSSFWEKSSHLLTIIGCALGFWATVLCLLSPEEAAFTASWNLLPGAALAFKLDALSAAFLFPAFLITAASSLYGIGYWPIKEKPQSGSWLRFFYPVLAGAIMLLLCSNNAILFLVNWEIMALAGYFLIITEREKDKAHKAGFIYLAATHTGTLALFGAFAILMPLTSDLHLPAAASIAGTGWQANTVFLLALFGFGFKAGLIPLHLWLPGAHANAPSNVSALMSGVMIKMGIYGLIRTTSFFAAPPQWWGQTILVLGLISAIFGVVLAIAQHDIKRLLAYHSVENIGIILLGLGIALVGQSQQNNTMIMLGLAGALLHVINHGLFKALLFLSAGSIIHKTGSRSLLHYGGLWKKMPYTGFFFLGGAAAICGLPPLNGFVSEWLVYVGIINTVRDHIPLFGIFALPGLAMTGGLALLCFAKVFGLSFLGTPRTPITVTSDSPKSMLLPMGLLFACCLFIGVLPITLLPFLQKCVEAWTGNSAPNQLESLVSANYITVIALALFITVSLLAAFSRSKSPPLKDTKIPTWGCGFINKISRVQYTTASFAQIITDTFGWSLQTEKNAIKPVGLFPTANASFKSHTPDILLDRLVQPLFVKTADFSLRIRHVLQGGIIGYYLLYILVTIALLFAMMHFF